MKTRKKSRDIERLASLALRMLIERTPLRYAVGGCRFYKGISIEGRNGRKEGMILVLANIECQK